MRDIRVDLRDRANSVAQQIGVEASVSKAWSRDSKPSKTVSSSI
jgi:hypothetical protein